MLTVAVSDERSRDLTRLRVAKFVLYSCSGLGQNHHPSTRRHRRRE